MKRKNRVMEVYGLWAADLCAIVLSFFLATYIRFGNFRDMGDQSVHFAVCLCFVLFSTVYTFFVDWNRDFMKRGYLKEFIEVLKYEAVMMVVIGVLIYFLQWAQVFSRFVMGLFMVINFFVTYFLHVIIKKSFAVYYSSELTQIKVLVVAESENAERVLERLSDSLDIHYGIEGVCIADAERTGEEILGYPVISGPKDMYEKALQMPLDEVFISLPDMPQKKVRGYMRCFEDMGVMCHMNLESDYAGEAGSRLDTFGDYTVLSYTRYQGGYKRLIIKRAVDILGGLVGSLITIIMTPFFAIAIKKDSPGPVFFRQTRIGRNGRRFTMYKFRSMRQDAEEMKEQLQKDNEMNGLMFKMSDDPRVTPFGKWIRKTSLDEFPQFFNILKGDMSLVGTRPPTEDEFEKYIPYYRRRMSMTPGLTGLWQISGRSEIMDFDEVVKLDLEYIDNWSLTLDLKILIKTVGVVLGGRGAK
ncbi:MAG: sugar transferase [Lachnospiraceae bacterium]|nr:sugar transferase [Lachnospiraceae bacterium]